jgi:hypothetical protein
LEHRLMGRAPGGKRSDIETVSRSLRANNRNFHHDGRGSKVENAW